MPYPGGATSPATTTEGLDALRWASDPAVSRQQLQLPPSIVDGNDIVVRSGDATWFSGADDPDDDGGSRVAVTYQEKTITVPVIDTQRRRGSHGTDVPVV